jgi:hypothetical protein
VVTPDRRRRATVEHVLARYKDWQVLRQIRARGQRIDQIVTAVVTVYNYRIEHLRLNS